MAARSRRLSPLARLLDAVVALYQLIPRMGPPRCKFYPSCSSYARTALAEHGALRGSLLAARRLGRCHPWQSGGIDHVPPGRRTASTRKTA